MLRRVFLKTMGLGALAGFTRVSWGAESAAKPNFLFIIADDCTYRDIGCYGGQACTPNIDKFATEGMRFTQCFQAAPMCSPTRHNIYTGLYPVKSGAYPNHTHVNPGVQSVVHYLKPLGYRVALDGKRHIGPPDAFPFEYLNAGADPDVATADRFIAECARSETPFCLFMCSHQPHTPWNQGDPSRYPADKIKLPPYFVDTPETREDMSKYLAEITYFDGQVGSYLALLDKNGVADNTLAIVVSEQGSSFPFGKWTCYDTGLQSAFIARWPGRIPSGQVNDALIEYVDVLPTYIEAAGGTPPAILDGKSLLPVLTGGKTAHKDYVYGEMTTRGIINGSDHFGVRSIRSKQFKYVYNFTPEVKFECAATKSKHFLSWEEKAKTDPDAADKVRRYMTRPAEELYDAQADPYEWNNLADDPEYADIKADLRKRLLEWMDKMGDKGQQTELEALQHMAKGKDLDEGDEEGAGAGKKAGKAKGAAKQAKAQGNKAKAGGKKGS
ncbi:MAG: sulfatase [Candidatus Sumerlaeota bacterium]|nr:sulfatase [Candidatus Sumerlaeota bacterium]